MARRQLQSMTTFRAVTLASYGPKPSRGQALIPAHRLLIRTEAMTGILARSTSVPGLFY